MPNAQESESVRQKLVDLSREAHRRMGCSNLDLTKLDVTVVALELLLRIHGTEYHFLLDASGSKPKDAPRPLGAPLFDPDLVLTQAHHLDILQHGFTLDELLDVVVKPQAPGAQAAPVAPRRSKNYLSRILRANGFYRKQLRRDGERPLLWFSEKELPLPE